MKRIFSTLAFAAASLLVFAGPRTAADALKVAQQFAAKTPALKSVSHLQMTLGGPIVSQAKSLNGPSSAAPSYYIVNVAGNNGFVVVSGDDRFTPVLGYCPTGNVTDETQLPEGFSYWMQFLSSEMDAAIAAGYADTPAKASAINYGESVEPLIKSKWGQDAPYNNKIPNFATGCVATGMAQVMNYWKYPARGTGSHTNAYNTMYSADFGATTYDWANMKNEYGGKYDTKDQVDAVSTLMYHLGVATDMRWGTPAQGSGTPNMYAGYALITFFQYNRFLHAEQRDCYSLGAWKALVINQLQTGHPLCYAGMTGQAGQAGHFFVLDGYDATTGLFHFNWGWSGSLDGYYNITALEPGAGGIGAGVGQFNYDQQMFVDVQPAEIGEYVAHFDGSKITPANSDNKRSVNIAVAELAHNSLQFKGVFGLAVYNTDGTLVKYVPSKNGVPTGMSPGAVNHGNYNIETDLSSIPDGTYSVCLAAENESYPGSLHPIRAYYGNATYFNMTVSGNTVSFETPSEGFYISDPVAPEILAADGETVYQNLVSQFKITVKNTGDAQFNDEVGVCIKKGRDQNPQYITIPCSLAPGEQKTITLSGKILRTPGDYDLYACYGDNGTYSLLDNKSKITVKDEASSVNAVETGSAAPSAVYTITGIRVADTHSLPRGIYIVNGKKIAK